MSRDAFTGADLGHSSMELSVKSGPTPLSDGADIFPAVVLRWSQIATQDTARKALADTVPLCIYFQERTRRGCSRGCQVRSAIDELTKSRT
jgi:hypothetical protein